jgi:hypothetical protein
MAGQLIARLLQEWSRDLIFVGYSYGGLVVKQVHEMARSRSGLVVVYLVRCSLRRAVLPTILGPYTSYSSRSRRFADISEHSRAVFFLGTLHQGSGFSS